MNCQNGKRNVSAVTGCITTLIYDRLMIGCVNLVSGRTRKSLMPCGDVTQRGKPHQLPATVTQHWKFVLTLARPAHCGVSEMMPMPMMPLGCHQLLLNQCLTERQHPLFRYVLLQGLQLTPASKLTVICCVVLISSQLMLTIVRQNEIISKLSSQRNFVHSFLGITGKNFTVYTEL
jgi:hypothetical protein